MCSQSQAKYFLNYSHNRLLFFSSSSSSISNGYLFALCLNERNKYMRSHIRIVILVHTHTHIPETSQPIKQLTQSYHCRSFQTTIKISNANNAEKWIQEKEKTHQHIRNCYCIHRTVTHNLDTTAARNKKKRAPNIRTAS